MGMLLYMMELSKNDKKAAGATDKVAPKPTSPTAPKAEEKVKNKPEKEERKVTRQEIMKMNVATVRAFAETQGIKNVDDKSGAELKRILVDKLFEESE